MFVGYFRTHIMNERNRKNWRIKCDWHNTIVLNLVKFLGW